MRKSLVLAGLLLLVAGTIMAQDDFPKAEITPEFEYIHTSPPFGTRVVTNPTTGQAVRIGNQSFNCLGGGGSFAYNFTSLIGLVADLDYCKLTNLGSVFNPAGANVNVNQFTYLFGPRFTWRGPSKIEPFGEILFGGDRLSLTCKGGATVCFTLFPNTSRNAFALGAGGGFNVKLTRRLILRPVDAEYLYTRFGNNCAPGVNLNVCHSNQSQNSFRLTSGLTIGWGGSARY